MVGPGLRERKKERTRRHIADTAARLFAERGYEQVAVTDVARAAEVAEQTVYNYFPAKEHLVTDREGHIQTRLCELIRSRPPDRLAAALAAAISDSTAVPLEIARLQGTALASVFQIIISESGRRTREGQSQAEIADELYPIVENLLDELDRWLSTRAALSKSQAWRQDRVSGEITSRLMMLARPSGLKLADDGSEPVAGVVITR